MGQEIQIPFNKWSKEKLKGHKRATSRSKVYGDRGDWFEIEGNRYQITTVIRDTPTWFIIKFLWFIEGADSPEELEKVIRQIFRGKIPRTLHLHLFVGEEIKERES